MRTGLPRMVGIAGVFFAGFGLAILWTSRSTNPVSAMKPGEQSTILEDEETGRKPAMGQVDRDKAMRLATDLVRSIGSALPESQATNKAPEPSRAVAMMGILDGRISATPPGSPGARQFQSVILPVVRDAGVGASLKAIACGEDLCRLTLTHESSQALERGVVGISESLGKIAGAVLVFDGKPDERIAYVAKDRRSFDLRLPGDPDPATVEHVTFPAQAELRLASDERP